jgi:hypothetical protein
MACDIETFKDATQAQSQAFWACSQLEWEKEKAKKAKEASDNAGTVRNIIAGLQQAASFYFADKQFAARSRELDRLDGVSNTMITRSGQVHGVWEHGIACERKQIDDACNFVPPKPNYQLIQARIRAQVAPAFALPRRQAKRRYGVHCRAAMCAELREIDIKEAQMISAQTEAAYRKDEALHEIRLATNRTHLMNVLQHTRGLAVTGGSLLSGTVDAAKVASSNNPYYGLSRAVNSAAGYWENKFVLDDVRQRSGFNSGAIRPAMGQVGQTASGASLYQGMTPQNQFDGNGVIGDGHQAFGAGPSGVNGDIGVIGDGDQAFGAGAGNSEPTVDPFTQNGWGT